MTKHFDEHCTKLVLWETKIAQKNTLFSLSMSQHCHQKQHHRMKTFCNLDLSNILTHPPFACSWFWNPTFASITLTPMWLKPLLMLFFFRFPFSQPNAWPREPADFFCPRWALASRAKISEMSLGTRSPVDLLRDILEDLGATPQSGWVRPPLGKMLASVRVCILPVRQHPGPEGWVRERMRWKMRIMTQIIQTGTQKEGKVPILKTPRANVSPSPLILDLYPVYEYIHTHTHTHVSDMWFGSARMSLSV